MRILLTGANSFIGTHLLVYLLRGGFEVVATHRGGKPPPDEMSKASHWVRLDLGAMDDFSRLPNRVDSIVHVAGVSTEGGADSQGMVRCNVEGAANILTYAKASQAKQLIYASTLSIHGAIEDDEVTERTPTLNPGVYGATKLTGERIFAAAADALAVAAIRLPGVLGAGAHRAWIPTTLETILADRAVTAFNPDSRFNNAAHVSDLGALVTGMLRGSWGGFHAFPVGAGGAITIRDAIARMQRASGRGGEVRFLNAKRPSFTISSDYAKKTFAYRPQETGAMIENYVRESLGSGADRREEKRV